MGLQLSFDVQWIDSVVERQVRELIGDRQGWDCKDVQFHILDLSFDQVTDQDLLAKLEEIRPAILFHRGCACRSDLACSAFLS